MSEVTTLDLKLPSGRPAQVLVAGEDGTPPLVYLHNATAVTEKDDFVLKLAENFRVYAPIAPGFNDLAEIDELVNIQDVALHYDDILAELNLSDVTLVGHSFGGMLAGEVAAHSPLRIGSLVLIAPFGLWNDEYPVEDVFAIPPLELGYYVWADPGSEIAQKTMGLAMGGGEAEGGDTEGGDTDGGGADGVSAMLDIVIRTMQGMITAGKYMMPIPDRGLDRRLYRVTAPTLLIWGSEDRIVPPAYAKDFSEKIANSKELILEGGGHMVNLECLDEVTSAITSHSQGG